MSDQFALRERRTHLREEFLLLLLDVVTNILREHSDFGSESLVVGAEAFEFGQGCLHEVVLFECLEDIGHRLRQAFPHHRIER